MDSVSLQTAEMSFKTIQDSGNCAIRWTTYDFI